MNGITTVPRWTRNPVPGTGECDAKVPEELTTTLYRLANDEGVAFSAVLLAAHARVLGALSGGSGVWTGYGAKSGPPSPLRLTLEPRTWRELLQETARAETDLLASRPRLIRDRTEFETIFEVGPGVAGPMPDTIVLRVCFVDQDGLRLILRYRRDALNGEAASRIAGYHITALSLMAADPDAQHARQSLLSPDELRYQILDLAGPGRELPDCRVHEVFEARVREHPDTIAAVCGDESYTYGELNARANRAARALLARGLRPESVVGVATERTLEWLIGILAVLKAGGVYLPVEPGFPAERIGSMLALAGCRLMLTDRESRAALERVLESLPGIETLSIDALCREDQPDGDPALHVPPGQLAYICFTSGTTGEPRGAMCEHTGLLNHLFAKIDDLDIVAGDVVAQTAPAHLDTSIWQLLAPILVGGRTLIVEKEATLEAPRFIERIVAGRVNILQISPSWLEDLLSCLEQDPRELPDLWTLSVTGESLKKELVGRWFSVLPHIPLVNAYRLTEASGDTNHEFIETAPRGDRVPIGRPINNVRVYIVDEHLWPVPLGAPGEIVVAGIGVGRGYVNDPGRTQRSFLTDPYHPGQRLHRSGDYGRWLPEGAIEYLGRREAQAVIGGGRKALTAPAGELEICGRDHEPPVTSTQRWLAATWAEILGIPAVQIGRLDHFFDLGGTSLSAVRLAIALDRRVSFKDLAAHPVLSDQAALLDHRLENGIRGDGRMLPPARPAPAAKAAIRKEEPHI